MASCGRGGVALGLARQAFGDDHRGVLRCAVTGTNGKTSTVQMLAAVLEAGGIRTATVSGLGATFGGQIWDGLPDALAIERLEDLAAERGAGAFVCEVTSRALANGWTSQAPTDLAIYTNLGQDHFDVHGGGRGYAAAKRLLFESLRQGATAVLNAADPEHAEVAMRLAPGVAPHWFSPARSCDVSAHGTRFEVNLPDDEGGQDPFAIPHIGSMFAANATAVVASARALKISWPAIRRGLAASAVPPGRFEVIAESPLVVVDFAHNDPALRASLLTARALARSGRVLVIFGAGGNRMTEKRAPMGRTAAQLCDHACITNDNPRGEDPSRIADAIIDGWRSARADAPDVELHRPTAIARTLALADAPDVVVIAGMGADAYQPAHDEAATTDAQEVVRFCE